MSHSHGHKHSRDRTSSSSFYKDYHSGDLHATKRRQDLGSSSSSRGGSSHYSTSYATNRQSHDDKKLHGHSSAPSYHSHSSSLSHRQQYSKPSGNSHNYSDHHHSSSSINSNRYKPQHVGGTSSNSGYVHSSSGSGRVFRKPLRLEQRKPYDRVSSASSGAGVRRIPPPLSPPPLMKISTSSASRYRQAPPEDRHYQKANRKFGDRIPRFPVVSAKDKRQRVVLAEKSDRKHQPTVDAVEKPKATKRSASAVDSSSDKKPSKIKKDEIAGTEKEVKAANGTDEAQAKSDCKESGAAGEGTHAVKENDNEERKHADDKEKVVENEEENENEPRSSTKPLLKLHCAYCDFRCVTYKDFTAHTRSFPHGKVMSSVIESNRKKLVTLKQTLRDQQKDLEKTMDDQNTLSDTTSYCRVCEINLRTDPKEHEANEIHNELKGLIHRRCEICDVDFRLWRVYIFHTVSLEHVKRVALKDMKAKEEAGTCVKGTNMTPEEIGIDLLEEKTVIFCKACVRYFPMREGEFEESRLRHCLTLNHASLVEEYNSRMKYLAKRDADEKARAEEKKRLKKERSDQEAREKEEKKKEDAAAKSTSADESKLDVSTDSETVIKSESGIKEEHGDKEKEVETDNGEKNTSKEAVDSGKQEESMEIGKKEQEDEDVDEDEIQLHADEDDEVDAPQEDQ